MLNGARVAVVVPAHNEERLIERTLRSIPAYADRVVVVDDGSSDRTAQLARSFDDERILVVCHRVNRGVGAAIATGYQVAFDGDADVTAVMAGDAQMDPLDLRDLLTPVISDQTDYAKGNRLAYPEARNRMPLFRWLGNHVLSWLTRRATGLSVQDSQCGFTALSRQAARRLDLGSLWHGYGYPNDMLGHLAAAGLNVRDVVVRPVYADEQSGIGWRHALFVVPFVLTRALLRRSAAQAKRQTTPESAPLKRATGS